MDGPENPTERLRRSYRPAKVGILFVGESAPVGGTFFYRADSQVYRYFRDVFAEYDQRFTSDFLDRFKAANCYLDDLVLYPINAAAKPERSAACVAAIPSLAERIRVVQPATIVAIAKTIGKEVRRAAEQSGVAADFHCVSFPGTGRQGEFRQQMRELLPRLLFR